jgi:hypothetical protein
LNSIDCDVLYRSSTTSQPGPPAPTRSTAAADLPSLWDDMMLMIWAEPHDYNGYLRIFWLVPKRICLLEGLLAVRGKEEGL